MNSLDRAKRFLAAKTAKLALAAIPLALAVPAALATVNGGPTITFGADSGCSVTGFGFCNMDQLGAVGGNSSANWVEMFTVDNGSNGGFVTPADGTIQLDAGGFGNASGFVSPGDIFPVAWDFTLSPMNVPGQKPDSPALNVGFTFSLVGSGFEAVFAQNFGALGPGTYTGTGNLIIPSFASGGTGALTGFDINFLITNDFNTLALAIPQGTSLDLNSPAPEPASLDMAALGMAATGLFGLFRRFRHRKV